MVEDFKDLRQLVARKANRRMTLLSHLLAENPLENLAEMHPYDHVELKNPAELKLLPKDCVVVPVFAPPERTTKKGKKRRLSSTADTMEASE